MTKVVLLAGGKGSRLNVDCPKPMALIGGIPIIEHIMNSYHNHGYNEFILATGYKKEYFDDYFSNRILPYKVIPTFTGEDIETGERLKRVSPLINEDRFCFSYGDGLSNINLWELEKYFCSKKDIELLISVVHPPERYGLVSIEENKEWFSLIKKFNEKPTRNEWINGGFMVCSKKIFDYLYDGCVFEKDIIPPIVAKNKAFAFKHSGQWGSIDTQKELNGFIDAWNEGRAFWTK